MTSESGAMTPLAVPKITPWVRSPSSLASVVEATWEKLEARLEKQGALPHVVDRARAAYAAGVYAASAAVLNERAHSRELSEAAERVERAR